MDHFTHLPAFHVVVCKKCQHAVLPNYIHTHLAAEAHDLGKRERQRIVEEVAEIDGLIGNEAALKINEFLFPQATSPPIAALGELKNRLKCTVCQYICCNIRGMRIH